MGTHQRDASHNVKTAAILLTSLLPVIVIALFVFGSPPQVEIEKKFTGKAFSTLAPEFFGLSSPKILNSMTASILCGAIPVLKILKMYTSYGVLITEQRLVPLKI